MFRRKQGNVTALTDSARFNNFINARCLIPFAAHDVLALRQFLSVVDPDRAVKQREATTQLAPSVYFCSTEFALHNRGTVIQEVHSTSTGVALPLPDVMLNGCKGIEVLEPRRMFLTTMFVDDAAAALPPLLDEKIKEAPKVDDGGLLKKKSDAPFTVVSAPIKYPRDGLHGLYFRREEVVDNLLVAAEEMKLNSPFWIRSNHPQLGKFLLLKQNSDQVVVSLTSTVFSIEDIEAVPPPLLHWSIQSSATSLSNASHQYNLSNTIRGMNALTGVVSQNPYIMEQLKGNGVWVSLDQIVAHNLQLKRRDTMGATKRGLDPSISRLFDAEFAACVIEMGKLVELEQWELYNGDSLQVPGRLALKQALKRHEEGLGEGNEGKKNAALFT